MAQDTLPPPCLMVVFGGVGDLANRLLIPALYNLAVAKRLPAKFGVVGIARENISTDEYRARMSQAIRKSKRIGTVDERVVKELIQHFHYYSGDSTRPEIYPPLKEFLTQTSQAEGTEGAMIFYLATPPALFAEIPPNLALCGLLQEDSRRSYRRIIFEKPFGRDLRSAQGLDQSLSQIMREDQIYRIDHYLGKETVQNIMVMRFANGIFEPVWNRRYIDSVQITVSETLGVENRGPYYESSGALRDMVPNHLFQLVSLIGMEPPNSFGADDVRDEKVKLLRAITPFTPDRVRNDVIRGQYTAGRLTPDGPLLPAYRDEPGIARDSVTETFVAMKLEIENWRWAGVPFYLRTGKRLPARVTEVDVRFRCAPIRLFGGMAPGCPSPNQIILGIQPEEKISLTFSAKIPGPTVALQNVAMDFKYAQAFGVQAQTGYETLLFDAMHGDQTLYQRSDQAEAAWSVVDPILRDWEEQRGAENLMNYAAGSWGPDAASQLLLRDGRQWRIPAVVPPLRPTEEAAA